MNQQNADLNRIIITLEQNIKKKIQNTNLIKNLKYLESECFGQNGYFVSLIRKIKEYSLEEKKKIGTKINNLKQEITFLLKEKKLFLEQQNLLNLIQKEKIDISLPAFKFPTGKIHPLNQIIEQIENFFLGLGYSIYDGTEVETDLYNFEFMNIGKNHPARDMQDSFYLDINREKLLRTHTSSIQIKAMLQNAPKPLKIISSGNVYRRDKDDATHSHQFTQLEGFVVNHQANLANLKETIILFIQNIFGKNQQILFRPSYFPFTNPSFEVDLIMNNAQKKNNETFLEVLGAGLIHPNILKKGGFNCHKYQGFAFGIGIERIAMLKYGIEDIRYFYNNDIRFLQQFNKARITNK
ncbi:MAG: phenylalanine--tRNA ligase subunit alpha [Weeping tea tree witches'-broom phytoplasma]|uniref:phenylalanine--tRNA ligase subunit alpha n=1 Tax=Candidatus Phytoplasma melaleucae TaxID=2982630 RepID=UPI00293AC4F4|nr:phenylalanine--tRNA ligase subunit alpha [Weeping tea tree witches'-broom phytoplasma]